jgi:UDP-N-acetylglucosamine--N-acetylmuramyl-(pentapeptide) pyrophosphoryl-undecaprenol N-acetylglucosamine transferase
MSLRLLIAGGGTGGHIFPALAVAEQLRRDQPTSEVLFVGSADGLEQRLVPAADFALETIAVGKLKGTRWTVRLTTLAGLPRATLRAMQLLRRFRPEVVVGVGGYASGPVVLAARLLRLPIVLLEQNAIPGATNRVLSRLAGRVVIAYPESARFFPAGRTCCLGNPVRPALVELLRAAPLPHRPPALLVLGGSQGARRLNELVVEAAPAIFAARPQLRLLHQTGEADHPWVSERYRRWPNARALPFVEEMGPAYAASQLVISRAGATTLAELGVAGRPALLVPYPFAADDHQTANARSLVAAGAARLLAQDQLTAQDLARQVIELLDQPAELRRMARAMADSGRPQAASAVVALLGRLGEGAGHA